MNPGTFYYVHIGTYCCVFKKVASGMYCSGSEFKYSGTIAKNECSIMLEICPTPNPTLNLHDRVDKCKTYYKNVFVEATVPFELPFCIPYNFPNLCRHVHLCI